MILTVNYKYFIIRDIPFEALRAFPDPKIQLCITFE